MEGLFNGYSDSRYIAQFSDLEHLILLMLFLYIFFVLSGRDEHSRCTSTFTHGFHGDGHEVEETLQVQICSRANQLPG